MPRTPGRKPKPAKLRMVEGNPGHRPINDEAKPPAPPRTPPAPAWLPDEARKVWRKEAPIFHRTGLLTAADLTVFAAYCEAAARYRCAVGLLAHAPTFMVTTKSGALVQHPHLAIARGAFKDLIAVATEFGATPSSRARVDVERPLDDDERADKRYGL